MRTLIIGLGSMGRRRIRCLKALGFTNIMGFDLNKERVDNVISEYNVNASSNLEEVLENSYDIMIISVPPNIHHIYMEIAIKHNMHCFIEAGIMDTNYDYIIQNVYKKQLIFMPSATLCFHPAIKKIREIIDSEILGKISNVIYHCGQYLPDWHKYESVADYYVSKKEMGGCREIVPFELTWLTKIFGFPDQVKGFFGKTIDIEGAKTIDDTYNVLFGYNSKHSQNYDLQSNYDDYFLVLTVDVVSRVATRKLLINGSNGQLIWDWNTNNINVYSDGKNDVFNYDVVSVDGYNKNITEQMYIDELNHFITNVNIKNTCMNTLEYDRTVLNLLYSIEKETNLRKTGILINVRLSSKRLQKKQLINVNNKKMLEILIERLYDCFAHEINNNSLKIIIASTTDPINKELDANINYPFVEVYYGNENNIPLRHLECSLQYGFTDIISIDGDDIFISKTACRDIYNINPQCMKTVGLPLGMNIIGMNVNHLRNIMKNKRDRVYNTGWTSVFEPINTLDYKNKSESTTNCIDGLENYDQLRLTLDYPEDATFFSNIINDYGNDILKASDDELLTFINKNKYYEINKHLNEEYWQNFYAEKTQQSEGQ